MPATSKRFIRMTYALPERLMQQQGDRIMLTVRVPNHPTRPARPWEFNSWLEEIDVISDEAIDAAIAAWPTAMKPSRQK